MGNISPANGLGADPKKPSGSACGEGAGEMKKGDMGPDEDNSQQGMAVWASGFFGSETHNGIFHGWRLVIIGAALILLVRELGGALAVRAFDHLPLESYENGAFWISLIFAGNLILWFLSHYIAGRGADLIGPRRMALIGSPLAGLLVLVTLAPAPGFLEATTAGVAALGLMGAYLPAVTLLNHWFRNRLALALAMMLFATVVGRAVIGSSLSFLLLYVDWRLVTLVGGLAIAATAWPLARQIRNRPKEWSEHPDGLIPVPTENLPDYSWREAVRSRQFWMLIAAGSCVASATAISTVYAGPIILQGSATFEAIDKAESFEKYASAAGILVGGLAGYHFPIRLALAGAAVVQILGITLLLTGFGPVLLEAVTLLSVASGAAIAPGIAIVGMYFGRRSFGTITVTAIMINYVASSAFLSPVGYVSSKEAYVPIFVAAAIINLAAAGLYLALGQPRLSPSQTAEMPTVAGAAP